MKKWWHAPANPGASSHVRRQAALGRVRQCGRLVGSGVFKLVLVANCANRASTKLQILLYLRNIMNEIGMKSLGTFQKKTHPTGPTYRFYHVSTWFHATASAFPEVWISVRWRMWWQIHPVSWSQAQLRSDAAMAWYYSWDPMSLSDDTRSMIPGIPDFKGKECPILFLGVRSGFCMNLICFQHLQDSRIQNAWVCLFAQIVSAFLNRLTKDLIRYLSVPELLRPKEEEPWNGMDTVVILCHSLWIN